MELSALQEMYQNHRPTLLDGRGQYAVLVPLVERPEGLCLLYEVRAAAIRQPGEVCFPGGRMEPGETAVDCALRETQEELGIPPRRIDILGQMDFLHLRSEGLMFPILAHLATAASAEIRPASAEVADTFFVPVAYLAAHPPTIYRYPLKPAVGDDFPYEEVSADPRYTWTDGVMEVPVYHGLPYPLWGLTARITRRLVQDIVSQKTRQTDGDG